MTRVTITIETDYDTLVSAYSHRGELFSTALFGMIVAHAREIAEPEFRMPDYLQIAMQGLYDELKIKVSAKKVKKEE